MEKLLFYVKILLFYKNKVLKKQLFYRNTFFVKKLLLYKNPAFLQIDRMYKKKKIKLTAKTVDEDPADVKKRHFDMKKLVFFFKVTRM